MSTAYGPLHSLTLAVCVISTIGVSLWGRWAMFRLRKLGDGAESVALRTKVGFAFRSLAYVPLLGLLVFIPPFRCGGPNCQPGDFSSSALTMSLVLGLLASALWVSFVFDRVYQARAPKLLVDLADRERILLGVVIAIAAGSILLMLFGQPAVASPAAS